MKEPANPFLRDFQRKRPRMNGLAGSLPFVRSNLCTRHILNTLNAARADDWPDKRRRVYESTAGRGFWASGNRGSGDGESAFCLTTLAAWTGQISEMQSDGMARIPGLKGPPRTVTAVEEHL